jgi:regulatory protein
MIRQSNGWQSIDPGSLTVKQANAASFGPPPTETTLRDAALNYLARYAATEAGLRHVLLRRIDRWARAQPDADAAEPTVQTARAVVDDVVRRLAESGAVSDTEFAANRARSLVRSGQSTRSIQMRLVAKGVAPDTARSVSATDSETELAAALVLARKRRIGPYRVAQDTDAATRLKEMALLARAGFSRDIVEQVLTTSREDAESRIHELRRT